MAADYSYSPLQIALTIMDVPIDGGGGEDTFLEIEYMSDHAFTQTGVHGDKVVGAIHDGGADIKVTLLAASTENAKFQALYDAGRRSPNAVAFGGFDCRDVLGADIHRAARCFIKKPPPVTYARGKGERVWSLEATNLISFNGGSTAL